MTDYTKFSDSVVNYETPKTQTIIDDYNDGTFSVWFTDDINDSSSGSSVRGTAEELIEEFADDIETLALLNEKINIMKHNKMNTK